MACNKPITGYRSQGGQVVFNPKDGWIDRPITIACGQCAGCRLERSRVWAVRIMHETKSYEPEECHFITLTYSNEELKKTGPTYVGKDRWGREALKGGSLVVRDWQDFARRARKQIGKFRYFHCGEYGDLEGRPHYHAAIFGWQLDDLVPDGDTKSGSRAFSSELLEETWGKGKTQTGELTFESAAYVARYIMKKVNGKKKEEGHYNIINEEGEIIGEKKDEYTTMSRREGIGKRWIEKWEKDVYPRDEVIINGKKTRPPKFYDGHYEIKNKEGMEIIKAKRKAKGEKRKDEQTHERLDTKEKILQRRMSQHARDL